MLYQSGNVASLPFSGPFVFISIYIFEKWNRKKNPSRRTTLWVLLSDLFLWNFSPDDKGNIQGKMFDALLSNVKRQTTLLTESWNELLADPRHPSDSSDSLSAAARAERMPSSIQKSLVSVLSTAGDSRYGTVPKSQSSSAVSSANNKQEPLKWPVLVNNERKWVSSTLFWTEKTQPSVEYDDNSSESETETVFCNPVTGSDCAADSEEESLVDKFNRVLATGKSSRRVCFFIRISKKLVKPNYW